MREQLLDKVGGVIFGTAIGDALGYPVEFVSVHERHKQFPKGIREYTQLHDGVALYSDDTQMMRAILEGLLRARTRLDFEKGTQEILEEFIAWMKSPDNNRAPGNACMGGCARLAEGKDWRFAGHPTSMGSGAAMRSMAYALWWPDFPLEAARWAALHARMTHGHPGAQEAAALTAYATALLMNGLEGKDFTRELFSHAGMYDVEAAQLINRSYTMACETEQPTEEILAELDGRTSPSALAAALVCLVRGGGDFTNSVSMAVTHCADADTVGAITGALLGASQGVGCIPKKLADSIEKGQELANLALRVRNTVRDLIDEGHGDHEARDCENCRARDNCAVASASTTSTLDEIANPIDPHDLH